SAGGASYISGNEAGRITREVAKVEKRRIVKSTHCLQRKKLTEPLHEVKEAEINLKVDERTKTLKLELMKMEETMLQQQAEVTMLKQRLEEVGLGRGMHDMDGGRFMEWLETYAAEQGMVKSMDLDMGDQQDSHDVKEIREDSHRHVSYPKQSLLDASSPSKTVLKHMCSNTSSFGIQAH
ncbi:hypothetical protein B296_00009767, partial [Ensete ventricosum]